MGHFVQTDANTTWQFATAGTVKFGRGCASLTAIELQRLQVRRPLVVTDRTVSGLSPVACLLREMSHAGLNPILFDACTPEPAIEIAIAAIEAGRTGHVDGVLGIGGGSNLDVAKVAAAVLKFGGKPQDYFGFDRIPGPILPLIALPTTAGTGSEVSHSAVLTDPDARLKVSTLSRWLRPAAAIVDPTLTDSCPPAVTAHSGIDALVHAIEAVTNRDYSQMIGVDPQARAYEGSYPLTRLLAAEAIRLIGTSLVQAYQHPTDHRARDAMALAAMLAGMAFSNSGVALVHALEYPVGALTHCSHGEGNGLLLPHVMRFNLPACTPQLAQIAQWMGVDIRDQTPEQAAESAIAAVVQLQAAIAIRPRLSQLGLRADQIPAVAEKAFQIKRLMDVNPRKPTEQDLVAILQAAY
jgi:alcohol dehydrogenase class IV